MVNSTKGHYRPTLVQTLDHEERSERSRAKEKALAAATNLAHHFDLNLAWTDLKVPVGQVIQHACTKCGRSVQVSFEPGKEPVIFGEALDGECLQKFNLPPKIFEPKPAPRLPTKRRGKGWGAMVEE